MNQAARYTVVITPTHKGICLRNQTRMVDSTTRSGATRKAKSIVREWLAEVTKRTQVDNYEYWKVEVHNG